MTPATTSQPATPTTNHPAMMELHNVDCGYGKTTILHDVSFRLHSGFHILIGPNGSGKTTLFRAVAGILVPSRGRVELAAGHTVGYSMHRAAFSPKMTLQDNLHYWSIFFGTDGTGRVEEVLEQVDLTDRAHQRVRELSRGLVQRLAVARALLSDSDILLLDEPLSGVDPSAVDTLLTLFQSLGDQGRCVVVSTHELAELNRMEGQVLVLQKGRVIGQGSVDQLLRESSGGEPIRWRVRGGDGVRQALRDMGLTLVGGNETDNTAEFLVADEEQAAQVNGNLTRRGVTVYGSSAVVDDLTRLYRSLESRQDGDQPPQPGRAPDATPPLAEAVGQPSPKESS
jgi:ABC-2 type transport system ATP-binding protein